ncbi:probable pectinesterase/pectinesterase inhibitor 35 [Aristolochia californica]|uniref:probable pectinesterase/pectinesterase inhibitor 35 n=1 Tax=Aristolochia californica TaxID=171875 RepID=UPI0035E38C0F
MRFFATRSIRQWLIPMDGDQSVRSLASWAWLLCLLLALCPAQSSSSSHPSNLTIPSAIASSCKNTLYPLSCEHELLSMATSPSHTVREHFDLSVQFAMNQIQSALLLVQKPNPIKKEAGPQLPTGMDDCFELLTDSLKQLSDVMDTKKDPTPDDIQTWLSASLTSQGTCLDSLSTVNSGKEKDLMAALANNLTEFISNSLALYKASGATELTKKKRTAGGGRNRKLLSDDHFPAWVSAGDRKLLEASLDEMGERLVVAQDGTGTHTTIGDAIAFASLAANGGRSVIHVTAGMYSENLKVPGGSKILLVGDGKGKTVVTGHKSVKGGSTTFGSATLAATSDGVMVRDMTIENTAGPENHQAVALLVKSDRSVIYRCAIVGYQDTLYTHSGRQFYRDTDIYGTVDFIFGNSAAVFQNCNIFPRKGGSGQKNYITAQGRSDPNQNTGISIQRCRIQGSSDTFLGRPWKKYSRTVFMQSFLDNSIDSSGWAAWAGGSNSNSLFYGEYMNSGPGAGTGGRVRWPGVHPALSVAEASKFTVAEFIAGTSWLPSTGVEFNSGLGA